MGVTSTHSPLILVVDDDRTLRALLRLAMEEEGYQVAEAEDGESCLSEFIRLHPDIVLMDGVMPVMDGFTCCRCLRTLAAAEYTPVLMITVLDDRDSIDRAFAAGATDYVTKPILWAVLRQRVVRLLEASRSFKQVKEIEAVLQYQTQREFLFRGIAERVAQSLKLAEILNSSVAEIREFLQVDRVVVYHQNGNLMVKAVAEHVTLPKLLWHDPGWEMAYAKDFEAGEVVAISDIHEENVPPAVVKHLELLNIKAVLMIPMALRGKWWGLIQMSHSDLRNWDADIVDLLVELGDLIAIAIERSG
ncbi:MAG TPA: hypothetical protein DDZ80_29315 [Cyanobacteria bacterium UBA8803]|nr:hypothetical protein [Cyanobacteria bacterium UBA8803]